MKSFRRHCESGDALAEVGIADQTGTRDVGIGDCQEHTAVILSFFSSSPVSRVRLSVKVSAM